MRILAIGPRAYLGDVYLSLRREGYEVRVFAEDPPEQRAFGGLMDCVADWRAELGRYHLVNMRVENGQLLGPRRSGHLMNVTGTGPTVQAAQEDARAGRATLSPPNCAGAPISETAS